MVFTSPEDYHKHLGVRHQTVGPPRSILEALTQRAFALVGEAPMERLCAANGVAQPAASSQEDNDRQLELSMALMAKLQPEWTDVDVCKALHTGLLISKPDTYSELPVDPGLIAELVTRSEAKLVHEYADQLETGRLKKSIRSAVQVSLAKKYFKTSASSHGKKPAGKKAAPRWWPDKHRDAAAHAAKHVEDHMPPSTRLFTDEDNGRFRVITEDYEMKSVSWTRRGFGQAAAEAISVAWGFHMDKYPGQAPPFDLNDLAAQFVADPS